MELSEELALSYYRPVADIRSEHGVTLVQHTQTGRFYVEKKLTDYNRSIYEYLRDHPVRGTPCIYEAVEEEGTLTVIEEYLSGDSLQDLLTAGTVFTEEQIFALALSLAQIVRRLHRADPPIIHRDIKPSNLILSPDGSLKLLDFNAAKYASEEESRDTVLLGTSGFAAPEQYGFASSGVQTDIYAIGVLLNVLRTGNLPFEEKADGKLGPIIRKCTQLDPKDRYPDIDALVAALQGAAGAPAQRAERKGRDWHRFLPPGFRGSSLSTKVWSFLGYVFLILVVMNMDTGDLPRAEQNLERVFTGLMILSVIFFSGNYLEIQSGFPFTRSRFRVLRFFGILLSDVLIVFLLVLILMLLETLLF